MKSPLIFVAFAVVLSSQNAHAQNLKRPPLERPAAFQPPGLKDIGIDQKLNGQLPLDLTFRDETGRALKLGEYFGTKPVIIAPVYYDCPMLCTEILNGLVKSLRAVTLNAGEQFEVIAVSFDPAETPPLALKKKVTYVKRYARKGPGDGWHFLTGDEASIKLLTNALGFRYAYDPKTKQFSHASGIMVATPAGKISRYLYGIDYAPRDVRLGLVEASENRIGTAVDQLMLFCFHYDPATGKYSAIALNILRLAAAATVLVLGSFLLIMFRREFAHKTS
ncbi:MAG: SCO family protein [Bryobacteraceae bacterium]